MVRTTTRRNKTRKWGGRTSRRDRNAGAFAELWKVMLTFALKTIVSHCFINIKACRIVPIGRQMEKALSCLSGVG
jgi:hypothetical protein